MDLHLDDVALFIGGSQRLKDVSKDVRSLINGRVFESGIPNKDLLRDQIDILTEIAEGFYR